MRRYVRNLVRVILAAFLTVPIVGCATERPDWIEQPYIALDSEDYIAVVTEGDSREAAETMAQQRLAGGISDTIGEKGRSASEYRQRAAAAGMDPTISAELLELDFLDSARRPIGLKINDRYYDRGKKRHYALGSVNKNKLLSTYETEMRRNKSLANRMLDEISAEEVTLRKFSRLRTAFVATEAYNDLFFARNRLGDPLGTYDDTLLPPRLSLAEIGASIADLRGKVSASIEPRGTTEIPEVVLTEIRSSLQRLDVPVRTDQGEGHVRILVTYNVKPVSEHVSDGKLVLWDIRMEVVEDVTGRSLDTLALDGKAGARTSPDAFEEASRLARDALGDRVDRFLQETLFQRSLTSG